MAITNSEGKIEVASAVVEITIFRDKYRRNWWI